MVQRAQVDRPDDRAAGAFSPCLAHRSSAAAAARVDAALAGPRRPCQPLPALCRPHGAAPRRIPRIVVHPLSDQVLRARVAELGVGCAGVEGAVQRRALRSRVPDHRACRHPHCGGVEASAREPRRRLPAHAASPDSRHGSFFFAAAHAQTAANPATATEAPTVEVIGIRPVPGLGTPLRDIPAAVQSATAGDLRERDPRELADHLRRSFAGINLNDAQGNAFQQNLNYRGFTASPLLGLPQGLSVFVDGVRVNEAFGDMVNWDLIPRNAMATAHLLSGSNPVFGLNTLGGVLTIQTKSGFAFPGTALRLAGGAFGRRSAEAETGGYGGHAPHFAPGEL